MRGMTPGTIVEYTNAKGSRRVVLINKRLNRYLEVTNDVMKVFKIPINRVNYLVEGDYAFEDMRNLVKSYEILVLGTLKEFMTS